MSGKALSFPMLECPCPSDDTLSGMLSFALYNLLKNPNFMAKLCDEIDEVIGEEPLQVSHLGKLPYLNGTWTAFKPT